MSILLVESEVRRFLSTGQPEVISITGHWGVGKTFAWKRYLAGAQATDAIALKRYAYVSLFGINSVDELKYAIFENSVKTSAIGIEPSLETLRSNTVAASERLGKKSLWFIQQIPFVRNNVGGLGPVWFLSVKDTIICLDDIERRGANLSARDVMGLISALKEQKECKVALIWNDDAEDREKEDFERYHEKVVDISLRFSPSARESVQIALQKDTRAVEMLAENCVELGVRNIRLIKRIERSVREIERQLAEFNEQILKQAISTLTLLGWSIYEPGIAPSIEFLRKKRGAEHFGAKTDEPVSEKEGVWNAQLDAYRFGRLDDFDLVLLNGTTDGFFDPIAVKKCAAELNTQIAAATLGNSFFAAWEKYHDSFDNNQEEVLDALQDSFFKTVKSVNPTNLNSTVTLFKLLGRKDQAADMIKHYVDVHSEDRGFFDLQSYPFAGDVTDPDVIQAFNTRFAEFREEIDPRAVLLRIAETSSWNAEDIAALAGLSSDRYYEMFKASRGTELRKMLKVCLQFGTFGNATPHYGEISNRAKTALERIGRESPINSRRVRAYGIDVSSASPADQEKPQQQ
ncbi:MAG TPA: hypothetical protein VFB04_05370 [Terriglobales bacterium]|nr:hypothetical protein [Terriglobales bacterium]